MSISDGDRQIIAAMQEGLPLASRPFAAIAAQTGLTEEALLHRIAELKARGVIRRIAAAPNHYKLGMTANGMTVWDVDVSRIAELGAKVGALPFVTHCYERPRALPHWPYNLFAMVHGATRDEVEAKRGEIAAILGSACRAHDILFSTRILKKTGLRLKQKG
ncbi:AsnC family transcriptional regulator [Ruegeria marina]|uniref:siroheme decarboxylase n=1 Tax=Ruegeria marina TaxID=639004 RepID=A0A1G6URA6_9RHOB|nr:AsnC family transcriptional regulator [Ruegeria marina]SDD43831.1 transcriptional regulator, AsnC family [Ruegeria marina]